MWVIEKPTSLWAGSAVQVEACAMASGAASAKTPETNAKRFIGSSSFHSWARGIRARGFWVGWPSCGLWPVVRLHDRTPVESRRAIWTQEGEYYLQHIF